VLDEHHLKIKLLNYCPDFLDYLCLQQASIISSSFTELKEDLNQLRMAFGTGPFQVAYYSEVNQEIHLSRNENYWRRKAFADKVIIKNVLDYGSRKNLLM